VKVGLYTAPNSADIGGGYTYGREVVQAIDAVRGSSRHEIVAVGWTPGPMDVWTGPYLRLRARRPTRAVMKAGRIVQGFLSADWTGWVPDRHGASLNAEGIDLIWAASGGTPTRNIPYVATIWDLQHRIQPHFPEVSAGREWLARERFYQSEIGRAIRVIVGTEAGRREAQTFYGIPDERIRKLPHPTPSFAVDAPPASEDLIRALGLEPGFVFYPAQFWPHKNHVSILRALRRLRDEHGTRITTVFVGSDKGNERHIRNLTEELGLGDSVRFLGFVPQETLIELYRNALALVYMSFFGPENLPPLEAFALGCPVLAARVAGSEEQLGEAAVLVEPTDDVALARAILELQRDPGSRSALIAKGHARARVFTTHDYAAGMLRIVDELAPIIGTWR
jgi:glycosyltransferase involved in cell wall biosynthesis